MPGAQSIERQAVAVFRPPNQNGIAQRLVAERWVRPKRLHYVTPVAAAGLHASSLTGRELADASNLARPRFTRVTRLALRSKPGEKGPQAPGGDELCGV